MAEKLLFFLSHKHTHAFTQTKSHQFRQILNTLSHSANERKSLLFYRHKYDGQVAVVKEMLNLNEFFLSLPG